MAQSESIFSSCMVKSGSVYRIKVRLCNKGQQDCFGSPAEILSHKMKMTQTIF